MTPPEETGGNGEYKPRPTSQSPNPTRPEPPIWSNSSGTLIGGGPVSLVVTIQTRPPRIQADGRRRGRNRTIPRGAANGGMATRRAGRRGNVNSDADAKTRRPFAASTGVRMEREDGSAARPTESPMARDRTDSLAGPDRDGWRRVLGFHGATVYHDGDVRTRNRPQGNRRTHGTAGRLLWATENRNNPMHARRRRRPRTWLNHARRPRDR